MQVPKKVWMECRFMSESFSMCIQRLMASYKAILFVVGFSCAITNILLIEQPTTPVQVLLHEINEVGITKKNILA